MEEQRLLVIWYLLFTTALVAFVFLYPVLVYGDWVWGFAMGLVVLAGCSVGYRKVRKTGRRSDLTSL